MKTARQAAILEIIDSTPIQTQEELADSLIKRDFIVTQATISRDIKELRLVKTVDENGIHRYAMGEKAEKGITERLHRMFSESVTSIRNANNLIVIKTMSGTANTAALVIDTLKIPEVLGTIAGDDTILVVATSNEDANNLVQRFIKML